MELARRHYATAIKLNSSCVRALFGFYMVRCSHKVRLMAPSFFVVFLFVRVCVGDAVAVW